MIMSTNPFNKLKAQEAKDLLWEATILIKKILNDYIEHDIYKDNHGDFKRIISRIDKRLIGNTE